MRSVASLSLLLMLTTVACDDDDSHAADGAATPDAVVVDGGLTPDAATPDAATPDAATPDAATPDAANLGYPTPSAYWTMDTPHVSGSTLADQVGSADGTLGGTSEDAAGKVGQARALDGNDDLIDFGTSLGSVFAGADKAFTVALWVKPASLAVDEVLIAQVGDTACDPDEDQRSWIAALSQGVVGFTYQTLQAGNAQLIRSDSALTAAGSWVHLAFVYDGSVDSASEDRVTIYVDGAAQGESPLKLGSAFPFDLGASAAHLGLGVRLSSSGAACTESGAGHFSGSVDELAIWDSAMDATQVGAAHQRGVAGNGLLP